LRWNAYGNQQHTLFFGVILNSSEDSESLWQWSSYGGEDGSTKEELMECGHLLATFFGSEEKGKEVLQAVDNCTWDMLD
jgi:hypothetical protein